MTWVDLSSVFTYGSKLTSTQMQNLRDNITAMANGDSGAPAIQTAGLDTDCITAEKIGAGEVGSSEIAASAVAQSELKTAAYSGSGTGNNTITGGAYCFYPRVYQTTASLQATVYIAYQYNLTGSAVTNIGMSVNSGTGDFNFSGRYVTASGEIHWLFVLRDYETGKILGQSSAPDHVCMGNGGKPGVVPHPFADVFLENGIPYKKDMDNGGIIKRVEILVFQLEKSIVEKIEKNRLVDDDNIPDKGWFESAWELYEIDQIKTPAWNDQPVTVGLPKVDAEGNLVNDWRFVPQVPGQPVKLDPIKKSIVKSTYMEVAQLSRKIIIEEVTK